MKYKAFVLRLWRDKQGGLLGQVSDPHSGDRQVFRDSAELWGLLQRSLTAQPQSTKLQKKPAE